MQDGFEKDIQKRMQDFNLEPSPQVWSEIDAALGEKKRRRFVIWWWLLPLMLAGGSIVWLYHSNYKSSALSIANNQREKAGEKNNSIQKENNKEETQKNAGIKRQDEAVSTKKFNGGNHEYDSGLNAHTANNKTAIDQREVNQNNAEIANANKVAEPSEIETDNINDVVQPSEVDKKIIQQKNEGIGIVKEKNDSTKNEFALSLNKKESSAFQFSIKDSTIKLAQKIKNKNNEKKRGNWLIIVGAGITSTKEHGSSNLLLSDSEDKSLDQSNGATGGDSYSLSDSTYKIVKPDIGYHFTAGVLYQYSLSKKWIISSGLQYRFLTNKQQGGKHIDASFIVPTANYSSGISVSRYYQAGYKDKITNTAHWLEIPLNISYTINPSAKAKIQLSAGASYAWMFAEKWLIPDSRNNRLYYSKQLTRKNIFTWQGGTATTFRSGWRIGLQYQQSISTVADKSVKPRLYWQNISLHTAFPLQIKTNNNIKHKP